MKKFTQDMEVIALIEDEKVECIVASVRGIMIEVETPDGEIVKVHRSKVKAIPKETCNRLNFGERSGKLTDEEVTELRELWGTMSRKEIAAKFEISTSYAYKLATGRAAKAVRSSAA